MPQSSAGRANTLVVVLSIAVVAGMAVALVLFLAWDKNPAAMGQGVAYDAAVAVCPPFLLVGSVGGITDSDLALIMTGGTIVFSNGALYAGFAAFALWILSSFGRRRR